MTARTVLVNTLTFLRVPLIFAWMVLAIVGEFRGSVALGLVAVTMMSFAGLSDLVDGWLARRWNVVTPLGKMADPLMDKVFYLVAFPVLAWQTAHRGLGDAMEQSVLWLGKVRTALLFPFAGLIYFYTFLHRLLPVAGQTACLWACFAAEAAMIVLNLYSSVAYTRVYLPYLKKALERK